jgi:hypothetical protein
MHGWHGQCHAGPPPPPKGLFTMAPLLAIPWDLAHAGLAQANVDFFVINEVLSVVDLINRPAARVPRSVSCGYQIDSSQRDHTMDCIGYMDEQVNEPLSACDSMMDAWEDGQAGGQADG